MEATEPTLVMAASAPQKGEETKRRSAWNENEGGRVEQLLAEDVPEDGQPDRERRERHCGCNIVEEIVYAYSRNLGYRISGRTDCHSVALLSDVINSSRMI